ncbi:MAG: GTPase Era [Bacteroidota bacterium]|jgi:GTP-binding protein Era
MSELKHRAGFVNIIGLPNAGKSTLMNALIGQKLSIVTAKAQTTRHRIMGILNGDDYQIVYSDTPGVLDPKYKLHEGMMKAVGSALTDADLLLLVIDSADRTPFHASTLEKIKKMDVPIFVVLNKLDLVGNESADALFQYWQTELPQAKIYPVSALTYLYTKELLQKIIDILPPSPPFFPKDELSDRTMRFFCSEIIREKLLKYYNKEIPYSCEVQIESYKEEDHVTKIRAIILTERESQKAIIIGHQGSAIKRMATSARKEMEAFLDKKVFLETFIKVDPDWRNNVNRLKSMGYWEQ